MPQKKMVLPSLAGLVMVLAWVSGAGPVSSALPAITPTPSPASAAPGGPPLSLTLTLLFTCCSLGVVVGLIVLGFVLSMQKRNAAKAEKDS